MNIQEVLKKLNKNVAEADQFKVASSQPDEYFVTDFYSTGNPYLDYKIGGGIPKGRFVLVVGGEGSAKTSITLITASNVQKEGKYVVYFDSENTVDESYLTRFNIDKEKFIHYKDKNLEKMLNAAEDFSKSEDVGMIVIDSIPTFTSGVVEEKDAEDVTMAVEARKFNARMPIIYGNCARRGITLVAINFYKLDPGAMGDNRKLSRGEWQRYMSSLTLEFTKKNKNILYSQSKELVGVKLEVKIIKSKLHKFDAKEVIDIEFYYDFGFSIFDDYARLLTEVGIIVKKGGWYTFPSGHKENGMSSVADFLESNPEYLTELIENELNSINTNGDFVGDDIRGLQTTED